MLTLLPLIVFILGLLLYLIPWPPSAAKLTELGRIFVWLGLAFLLAQAVVVHDVRPLRG